MPEGKASFWVRWRTAYDEPDADLSRRLRLVSVCAGQGRDVIGDPLDFDPDIRMFTFLRGRGAL